MERCEFFLGQEMLLCIKHDSFSPKSYPDFQNLLIYEATEKWTISHMNQWVITMKLVDDFNMSKKKKQNKLQE